MGQALDVANSFYSATNERRIDALRDLVADDVSFVGPTMQASGAAEYVGMNEQLLGFHQETRMLQQFEQNGSICSIYELDMSTPAGGVLTITMADWLEIADGKIASQRIYFDPREFASAFGL
ncbi:MAG: nuclear transport factor 2 family protein [Gaiellaceae bacterium]